LKAKMNYLAALSLAQLYRERASALPSGYYRISHIEQAKHALCRAKILRINAIELPEWF